MAKKKSFTKEDDDLLGQLGVEVEAKKETKYTAREERIIAGFEDIQRFVDEHGRLPEHGESRDIFERLYAVRLDRIRESAECRELLASLDTDAFLECGASPTAVPYDASDDELLEALGVEATPSDDITQMRNVRPHVDRKAAEEVAQRKPCEDFDMFRPVFEKVQQDLKNEVRKTTPFQHNGSIEPGDMFILGGQKVLVADSGEAFVTDFEREDRRLRVIYDNGTESNLLLRSLQRGLYKDNRNRRILPPDEIHTPLFSTDAITDEDVESGTIYVLRSKSDNKFIAEHRDVIHKIGVTGGEVNTRVANAKKDPTFLLAEVEVVTTYKLVDINRKKLEKLLHGFFQSARMDVQLKDRFGAAVQPREWFLVPLPMIQKAIELLISGEIKHFHYDADKAKLIDNRNK